MRQTREKTADCPPMSTFIAIVVGIRKLTVDLTRPSFDQTIAVNTDEPKLWNGLCYPALEHNYTSSRPNKL